MVTIEKNINFSCNDLKFAEEKEKGMFEGLLVNYKTEELAHGYYKFIEGSMKKNNGKTLLLMWNHMGNRIPVGSLIGEENKEGFRVTGNLQLAKDEGGYVNKDAFALYDLMKNHKAKLELSVGGSITKGESKETTKGNKTIYSYNIEEFNAHEGSLTPRGAVKGSKVSKVFNEKINENMEVEMTKDELREMFNEFSEKFKNGDDKENMEKAFSELKLSYEAMEKK